MDTIKKYFCLVYDAFLKKAIDEKSDPIPFVLDFLFGSECKYCFAVRCLVAGIGIGLANWVGAILIVLSVLCALGERYWLCNPKEGEVK